MATYTKTTNFTAKDNLTSGDPAKVIKGSEFDTEFNAIETAVNSKANANNGVHTGTTTISTVNIDTLQIDGVTVTSTSAELNKLDGFTGDVTDLNKLASVTATATEINVLDGSTATTADLNKLAGVTATSTELNLLDGVTATTAELNFVDGVTSNVQTQLNAKQPLDAQLTDIAGLTPADGTFIVGNGINFVAESGDTAIASLGITATATELNVLDGITATTTELNYTDGVTSNIQTQLNTKAPIASPTFTGTTTIPTVDINGGTIDGVSITGTTASFSGEISANGGIALGDNDKATFGASDDLQIYHDGSNSYITDAGTGSLRITAQDFRVRNSANNASMITSIDGGSTYLYDNGSQKLQTTSTGVDVTGTVTADGLTVETTQGNISVSNSVSSLDFGRNAYNYIRATQTSGGFYFITGANDFSTKRLQITEGGDVSFYEDTGTTAKFVWDSSAERLGIGGAPNNKLHINGDGGGSAIARMTNTNGSGFGLLIDTADTNNARYGLRVDGGSGTALYVGNGGNVGIGTSSPSTNLHVSSLGDTILRVTSADGNGAFLDLGDASDPDGGRIVYDSGSNLVFNTNSSERLRIDSSGNVGIGTASPTFLSGGGIHIENSSASRLHLTDNVSGSAGTDGFNLAFAHPNTYLWNFENGNLVFATNNTERARIDSSGNLLVGKTSASLSTAGITAYGGVYNGLLSATRDGAEPLYLNRLSNDGTITSFQKDGTTVGSIGTNGNHTYFVGNDSVNGSGCGLLFGINTATPVNRVGTPYDGLMNLGSSSQRFKDLYLSGDVNVEGVIGKSYSQTSTSGTTSIIDTGLFAHQLSGAIFDVYFKGTPNSAGSGTYRAVAHYNVIVTRDFNGSSIVDEITQTKISFAGGGSGDAELVLTAVFWDGTNELTTTAADNNNEIRLKISGYNPVGTTGENQEVRITRRI